MSSLKVMVLKQEPTASITNELIPLARERGFIIEEQDISGVSLTDFEADERVQALLDYDLVYYRTGLEPTAILLLEKFLKAKKVPLVNAHFTQHPLARFKGYQTRVATVAGIPVPATVEAIEPQYQSIADQLGKRFVAKAQTGQQGADVHLIKSADDVEKLADSFSQRPYIFQEFIPHRHDVRVYVAGEDVATVFGRVPPEDDFRTNIHRGGHLMEIESDMKVVAQKYASKYAKAFDFEVIAVDFIVHADTQELYFTEVNLNPAWEKDDQTYTRVDFSEVVLNYFETLVAA